VLTFAYPGLERFNLSTLYVFSEFLLCLHCGYTEVRFVPLSDTSRQSLE
jgi:hypothetical protein